MDDGNTYPLDTLGADFAAKAAAEFDSKYDLMQYSFGDHNCEFLPLNDDGKLNMLYYNIIDGWTPGVGYMAGWFNSWVGKLP